MRTEHVTAGPIASGAAVTTVPIEHDAPLSDLVGLLGTATRHVRTMAVQVLDASTDAGVRMEHLASLIQAVNSLGRACAGVEAGAVSAFARRDEVTDTDDVFATGRQERVRASGFVHDDAGLEVAHLLAVSEGSGATRVERAVELTHRMPLTLAAVTEGHIEIWQAHQLLDECRLLDDEEAREVDEWLHGRLGRIEPTRLRATARYGVGRVNPDKVRRRAEKARRGRTLEVCPSSDPGLAQLYALIPSHHAAAIWEAASTLAKDYQELDPSLTIDQARADAFVDLLLADVDVRASVTLGIPVVTSATSAVGDAHEAGVDGAADDSLRNKAPEDYTTEDLDRLFGPEDQRPQDPAPPPRAGQPSAGDTRYTPHHRPRERIDPDESYDGPGSVPDRIPDWMLDPREGAEPRSPIPGAGPLAGALTTGVTIPKVGYIPSDVVATLLGRLDLRISRALLDASTGTVLETVTDAYRPSRRMRDFVRVRDGQCRMYGCARPAAVCDVDHAVPHDAGGPTSPQNLAGLCRHHHRAKQSRAWTYHLDPLTGVATWINTRTGTIRATHPATSLAADTMRRRRFDQPALTDADTQPEITE
ncbi:MAG: DUF222 domain-containing protein [Dermatophilaceae bacterium]